MRRYRLRRKLKWLFEACAALFFLTCSTTWLPIATEFCAGFSRQLIAVFKSHLFVFVLFNLIIFLIYALSAQVPTEKHLSGSGSGPDLYDEFVSNSMSSRRISTGSESPAPAPAPEVVFEDKQIICSENVASPPSQNNRDVAKPKGSASQVRTKSAVCTDTGKALVVKCYRRTKSENFNLEKVEKPQRREFQRSDTEIEPGRRSSSVDDQMSNDEFNHAIETFIATVKSIQRKEYKEEQKTQGGDLPLTLSVSNSV
ncbi:hypothetical protein FEM48_Zijuj06G0085100 [Ziziphus jujuba var. spinosa]|nr:hypothetical protein FEM48_Zijuj06G0085100 [Ziziphus jujuba var. spinosa]